MARTKLKIDWENVGEMLKAGCSSTAIAQAIGISTDTLYRRSKRDNNVDFTAFSQQKRAQGEYLLRQRQFELAMNGNVSMLIWLGKQRLGQSEKQETKIDPLARPAESPEGRVWSLMRHAKRIYEVADLNPLELSFDRDNPTHIKRLKETLVQLMDVGNRLYPEAADEFEGWEEYFEKNVDLMR